MNESEIMQKIQRDIKLIRDRHKDMEIYSFKIYQLAQESSNDMDILLGETKRLEDEENGKRRKKDSKSKAKGTVRKEQSDPDRSKQTETRKEGEHQDNPNPEKRIEGI